MVSAGEWNDSSSCCSRMGRAHAEHKIQCTKEVNCD